MNKEDKNILGAFLLARHIEELTIEEIKDVQQAIKRVWNNFDKAIEYIKRDDIFVEQENNGGRDIEGNLILIKYSVKLNLLKILRDKENE